MKIRANQGESLDALCFRVYGQTKGMNELVLEANPGLARLGAILPLGHLVEMPNKPAQENSQQIIQLWD